MDLDNFVHLQRCRHQRQTVIEDQSRRNKHKETKGEGSLKKAAIS